MLNSDYPLVSVVMPIFNEERYIKPCIESLLKQDYPKDRMEWIFVDGLSTDKTLDLMNPYILQYPNLVKVLENPNRTVPYAMNIGIAAAMGEIIIRLDAHADYAGDYIASCVRVLEETGADNVGGVAETKGRGLVGQAIAKMLSSRFGVGNSQFRTQGEDGFVDTVPFGAFRRSVFDRWGGYDERLTRNQDNEMNYRIRKNGGKIFLSNDIRLTYYCRDTLSGITKMAFQNGMWNVIAMKLCPGSMGIRHFIPLTFVASLVGLPLLSMISPLFAYLLVAEVFLYLSLDALFSAKAASCLKEFLLLLLLFPLFHISYGCGSVKGLLGLVKMGPAETVPCS